MQINNIKINLIDDLSFRKLLLNFTNYECHSFLDNSIDKPAINFALDRVLISKGQDDSNR